MPHETRGIRFSKLRSDLVESFREWNVDNAPQFAGAIAFYAILSLGPLLVFSVSISAIFFEAAAARGEIVENVQTYVGRDAARLVQRVVRNASERRGGGVFANVLGFSVLAFGASRIFQQLKIALNSILDVPNAERAGVRKILIDRIFSVIAVAGFGLFLMASLVVSTILGRLDEAIDVPFGSAFWQVLSQAVSLSLIALVFALILRYLPDTDIPWSHVWEGAVLAAALFTIGHVVLSVYLSRADPGSSFGAAGPVIVMIVWIYFTTVIFFYGAEFMEVRFRTSNVEGTETARSSEAPTMGQDGASTLPNRRWQGSSPSKKGRRNEPAAMLAGSFVGFLLGLAAAMLGLFLAGAKLIGRVLKRG